MSVRPGTVTGRGRECHGVGVATGVPQTCQNTLPGAGEEASVADLIQPKLRRSKRLQLIILLVAEESSSITDNSPANSQSLDIDDITEVQVNFKVEDQEVIDVIESVIDAVFEASSSQTRVIVSQIVADLLESFGHRKEDCYVAFEDAYDGDDEGELMVAEDESDSENQSEEEDEMM